jgi:membrane protease YdiL (CAAX protease family)
MVVLTDRRAMRVIEAPVRAGRVERALALFVVAVYAGGALLPSAAEWWLVGVLGAATAIAFAARAWSASHAALLTFLHYAVFQTPIAWPLSLVVVLVAYGVLVGTVPPLRASCGWLRRGVINGRLWAMIAAYVAVSATALVVWRYTTSEDVGAYRSFIPPGLPRSLLWPGIVLVAMLNASFEEAIWRGAIFQSLEATVGRGWVALALQGIGFGVWHFRGFPRGWVGVGLATIFALMMGILRMRDRGMLAPWVAHVFADVTIFTMVAAMVLYA